MAETILETRGLTKCYGQVTAVERVNLHLGKGDIYGLIGKNGAGKTTLIRMVTSLVIPTEGEIVLFGQHTAAGLNTARKRIGSIIETPAMFPNLTAEQNMEYYRKLYGVPERANIRAALEMVGLADTGRKKFKDFSLGMKQRLGLALAILGRPDLILLDEPINGLDPIGIIEMRETLRTLNEKYDITILISSHILSELSQIATRYGIIDNGRLAEEITAGDLAERQQRYLSIRVSHPDTAAAIFERELGSRDFKVLGDGEIRLFNFLDTPELVSERLVMGGAGLLAIHEVSDELEDYFKAVIEEGR